MSNLNEQAAQALEDAADYILVNGHRQDGLYGGGTDSASEGVVNAPACAMGALYAGIHWTLMYSSAMPAHAYATDRLTEHVQAAFGKDVYIPTWNDTCSSAGEVIDTLKSVAKDLRNDV